MNQKLQNEQQTIGAGQKFASVLNGGDIVLLFGDLGAGKTTFTKGIAKGLGIKNTVTSPTFALMNVYPTANDTQLVHVDTYRLNNSSELIEIGIDDYLGKSDTITIIEWPEKITELLKNHKTKSLYFSDTGDGKKISESPN